MPAEGVSGTVSVRPDPCAQPSRLTNQLLARHPFEVLVHATSLPSRWERTSPCCPPNACRSAARATNAPTPAWLKADVARVGCNGLLDGAQIEPFAHGN